MKNWGIKKLGEVYDVRDGTHDSPKYIKEGFALITSKNLKNDNLNYDNVNYITEQDYLNINKRSKVDVGDILFAMIGTIGNPIVIKDEPDFAIKNVALFKVPSNQDSYFLKYYLDSGQVIERMIKDAKGATQKFVGLGYLRNFEIPIPPLPEQQRIVAILDEAFVAIAKAKANAEQNLKNAKELFESYLQGVFENKGEGWVNAKIGETCNLQTGGTPSTSKKEFYEGGTIKWLVSGDINQKVINDCEGRITELGMNNSNTKYLPVNSVLIALNGQGKTRGTVAMLRTKATCNQSLVSIFPKDEKSLLPELVFSNLEGRYDEIRKMTGDSGNDRRGLNMPLIRSIKFSHPKKINEQKEIIKKLDALRSETKKLEAIYQQKINDLEELKKSVLQKAFSGELKTIKEVV